MVFLIFALLIKKFFLAPSQGGPYMWPPPPFETDLSQQQNQKKRKSYEGGKRQINQTKTLNSQASQADAFFSQDVFY